MTEERFNEGQFRVYHDGLEGLDPELGCSDLEVDYASAVERVKDEICLYAAVKNSAGEVTSYLPVPYRKVVYLKGYPKDCIHYSVVKEGYYYWNTVHKILYTRNITGKQAWIKMSNPVEFVDGKPEEIISLPVEGTYYCDSSISSRELQSYTWTAKGGWVTDKILVQLIMSPISLGYDPETTDYSKLYYDTSKNDLYKLDPFVFLVEVEFKSAYKHLNQYLVYERPFAYIDESHTKYFDVQDTLRFNYKDIIFISKDPNEHVENPQTDKYYRNEKENKWYVYNGTSFITLEESIINEFGEPIYLKGDPKDIVKEDPKTDRPYVNILSKKIFMYKDNEWVEVGNTILSNYHPSKDFY